MANNDIEKRQIKKRANEMEKRLRDAYSTLHLPEKEGVNGWIYLDKIFLNSACEAALTVIEAQDKGDNRPEAWKENPRAHSYLTFLKMLKYNEAQYSHEQETKRKNKEIAEANILAQMASINLLRDKLSKNTKPVLPYPIELTGFYPEQWCEIHTPSREMVRQWTLEIIYKQVPKSLINIVDWDFQYDIKLLPSAYYEVKQDIPSLIWQFHALVFVTANLTMRNFPIYQKNSGCTKLVNGKEQKLGEIYHIFDYTCDDNFNTPIILLRDLYQGKIESQEVTVINRSNSTTTFLVGDSEVAVHDNFVEFIHSLSKKKIPLWKSLLKIGLIDKQVSYLFEQKWNQKLSKSSSSSPLEEVNKDAVADKLMQLGWAEADAINVIKTLIIPPSATINDIVKSVIEKQGG